MKMSTSNFVLVPLFVRTEAKYRKNNVHFSGKFCALLTGTKLKPQEMISRKKRKRGQFALTQRQVHRPSFPLDI